MREITFVCLDWSAKAKCVKFVFLLQWFTMKALALCTVFSALAIALSQPTYLPGAPRAVRWRLSARWPENLTEPV